VGSQYQTCKQCGGPLKQEFTGEIVCPSTACARAPLLAQVARLQAAIVQVQWDWKRGGFCPFCGNIDTQGHTADCIVRECL
jgi:hypothetical protein